MSDRFPFHAPRHDAPPHAKRILCVDADDSTRLYAAELLYEYEVDFALTGDDAVQLAHARSYDLYLVDPDVPGCDNIDLLDDLRTYDPAAPVILCTRSNGTHPSFTTAHACVTKPYAANTLREAVNSALENL